ncbi:MAG: hypothetical protein VX988_04825 [Planctomycetota bacterium]|nr:hypothetical protein [Planctomycetota bacterium]MEE3220656.1 hypothetical protein [Planctomycetota bacterium]
MPGTSCWQLLHHMENGMLAEDLFGLPNAVDHVPQIDRPVVKL